VASAGGQNDARVLLFDLATKTPLVPFPLAQKTQFESWNPDGTQYVGVGRANSYTGPENLRLFDGNTGMMTGTVDLGGLRADHPDWSRDGASIVFTSVDTMGNYTDQRPGIGGIGYVQNTTGAWGAPRALVPSEAGKNRYYPAIAPDSDTVVFNESSCPTAGKSYEKDCNGDTDPTATLFVTHLSGGAPIPLTAANSGGVLDAAQTALTNTYAKWAPFEQYLDEQHTLMWLTVSSARRYGLRSPPAGESENPVGTLIWMAGVNKSSTQDPSYAAFCLPFQDIATSNHIAQWADFYVPAPG
jgi:Tol biopolymer transport system component